MNKKGKPQLQLDMTASIDDKSVFDLAKRERDKQEIILNRGAENIIFKNENMVVGSQGIKNIATGEIITSAIDPNDLEKGDIIGSGASGSVHLARYKPKNIVLAIKSINMYDKDKRKQYMNDFQVLSDNKCPFLVHYYGTFFEEGNMKLLLEYMNLGSLDRIITTFKKKKIPAPCVPETILAKITQQILQGLLYLHKANHQIHRDIKPANILINTEGVVKLTDFGISKTLGNTTELSNTYVGTKNFMSPQRVLGQEYSYSSDVWSLGLVIYELASGVFPYLDSNDFVAQIAKIVDGPEPLLPKNATYSPELHNFIARCMKKDPNERDSVIELCNHPWIFKYASQDCKIANWLAELYDYELD